MTAILLKNRIEADLQVQVLLKNFLGDRSIAQLAELVLNQLALTNLIATEPIASTELSREKLSL